MTPEPGATAFPAGLGEGPMPEPGLSCPWRIFASAREGLPGRHVAG